MVEPIDGVCKHEYEKMDWDRMICACGKSVGLITAQERYGRMWPVACGLQTVEEWARGPLEEYPMESR